MKTKYIFSAMAALLLSFSAVFAQCTFSSAFGSATAGGPGSAVTITTCQFGGEYAPISGIVAGETYKVTSSIATDFITIHTGSVAGPVISFAVQGTPWVATVSGTYYAHTSTNAACGTASSCRTTAILRSPFPSSGPSVNCLHTSSFGSATINTAGALVTISTCSFAGEFSTVSGAVAGQTLVFTSSAGDYITVRSGTSGGAIVAQGLSPLTFVNTFTGTLFPHWSLATACGTENTCRTTTVQCTSCSAPGPVNDLCSAATPIVCGGTKLSSTTLATFEAAPACVTSVDGSPSVWYKFIGTGQFITMNTCDPSTNFDTKLHVYTGGCSGLTCVTGNDDYSGCALASLRSQVQFCSEVGTIYLVRVSGFGLASGNFGLNTLCGAAPTPVISAVGPLCVGGASVTLFGSPAGGTFSGTGVSGGVFSPSAAGVGSHVITYTLCGSSASTTVVVNAGPSNDLCANAIAIGLGSFSGTTTCATNDGTPVCGTAASTGAGVWYTFVGDGNQWTITTCNAGTNYDSQLSVYTGGCGSFSCVAGNDDIAADGGSCSFSGLRSRVHFCTTIGVTYHVLVHGFSASTGNFQIDLTSVAGPSVATTPSSYACGFGVSCLGACDGSATAAGSGGSGSGYTYLWSTGATTASISGLCAGTYGVTVTDGAGCQGTGSVTISSPTAVTVNAGPNVTVVFGYTPAFGCTTLNATGVGGGCGPYTYLWSNGATTASTTVCPASTTDYTVTVTDANGCSASDVVHVCVVNATCGRDKVLLCHVPPGGGGLPNTLCIGFSAVAAHLSAHAGDNVGPCSSVGVPCTDATPRMEAPAQSSSLNVYPNPFSSAATLEFTLGAADMATLTVFNLQGVAVATLFNGAVDAGQKMSFEFSSTELADGIYVARLTTNNGEVQSVKMMIQR